MTRLTRTSEIKRGGLIVVFKDAVIVELLRAGELYTGTLETIMESGTLLNGAEVYVLTPHQLNTCYQIFEEVMNDDLI